MSGAGQTQATFSSSSSTNRVTVTLNETTHPGLFRGFLTLVATNAAANQLPVRNGDTITARYFDASNNSNVVATASHRHRAARHQPGLCDHPASAMPR